MDVGALSDLIFLGLMIGTSVITENLLQIVIYDSGNGESWNDGATI
jgi:hypothetical protein